MTTETRNTDYMKSNLRWLGVVTLAGALGLGTACSTLDVKNPNEPDAERILSDPGGVRSIAGGSFRSWFFATQGMNATGPLVTMADSYTASWNNFNMRIYSSHPRTNWRNDPAAAARTTIETYWYGYYSALSSANDVVTAIEAGLEIDDEETTNSVLAAGRLMQGMALCHLALNYDKAFIVTETSDLTSLEFSPWEAVRDTALVLLDAAADIADGGITAFPAEWFGGQSYTASQVARLARTFGARCIAYSSRNSADNAAADWATVATLASQGISSGTRFDFKFIGDGSKFFDELKLWSNDYTTMRVDTRVANLLDPATQQHPWPEPNGNPRPNSVDDRLGNGLRTGAANRDFIWDPDAIFIPARGMYHQSNISHIRYEYTSFVAPDGSGGGFGDLPVVSATENDLLWAEGLIRSGGSLATAANLINNTRVNRGGAAVSKPSFLPATAADGVAGLLAKLQYEQEIELMGLGPQPFYNRRRIDGLQPLTPRHMPVPAKELGVLQQELYTFGGSSPVEGAQLDPTVQRMIDDIRSSRKSARSVTR